MFNPIASVQQERRPPSRNDGVSQVLETDLRACTCILGHAAGVFLNRPALVVGAILIQQAGVLLRVYVACLSAFAPISIIPH